MLQDTFIIDVAMVQLLSIIFLFVVNPNLQNLYGDFPSHNPDAQLFVKDVRLSHTTSLIFAVYFVGLGYYLLKKFLFPPRESIFDKALTNKKSKSKTQKTIPLKSLAVPLV